MFNISNFKTQISKLHLKSQRYFFVSGFIFLFLILNIFFADRPLLSLYGAAKLFEFAFLAIYIAKTIRYTIQLFLITCLFSISAIFESLLAIFQYLNQGSLNGIFYFFGERTFTGSTPGIANADIGGTLVLRPYATFPHPNVLAGYLLLSIVLIWNFLLKNNSRWLQLFGAISLTLCSSALLLTLSRVAIMIWLSLLLFTFMKLLVQKIKTFQGRALFVILSLVLISLLGSFHISQEVLTRFTQTSLSDESVTERTELLTSSTKMIEQHPIFGVGLYNFIPALAPLQKPMPLGLYLQPVHNIFVLAFSETGIIGFGLFVWLIIETIQRIRKQESGIRNIFFVLLLTIIVTGSFDHYWLTLQQGQLLFAAIIGISWVRVKNLQ